MKFQKNLISFYNACQFVVSVHLIVRAPLNLWLKAAFPTATKFRNVPHWGGTLIRWINQSDIHLLQQLFQVDAKARTQVVNPSALRLETEESRWPILLGVTYA